MTVREGMAVAIDGEVSLPSSARARSTSFLTSGTADLPLKLNSAARTR